MNRLLATFALASAVGAATAARAQTAKPVLPAVAPTMNSDFFSRLIQAARYISLADAAAQLKPSNDIFSHSMLYTFDPYTNLGATVSI